MNDIIVRGVRLELYEHEAVCDAIRRAGDFYEAAILDDLRARRPTERVIVDAGANIGNHSAYWAAFVPHDAILAFEPMPDSFAILERNLACDPMAYCYRLALSDHAGMLRMAVDNVNRGRCHVSADGTVDVLAVPLDALLCWKVSLLKVDVEGHQAEVLTGARTTLERDHPAVLVEDEEGTAAHILAGLGYQHVAAWPGHNHLWEWP